MLLVYMPTTWVNHPVLSASMIMGLSCPSTFSTANHDKARQRFVPPVHRELVPMHRESVERAISSRLGAFAAARSAIASMQASPTSGDKIKWRM